MSRFCWAKLQEQTTFTLIRGKKVELQLLLSEQKAIVIPGVYPKKQDSSQHHSNVPTQLALYAHTPPPPVGLTVAALQAGVALD